MLFWGSLLLPKHLLLQHSWSLGFRQQKAVLSDCSLWYSLMDLLFISWSNPFLSMLTASRVSKFLRFYSLHEEIFPFLFQSDSLPVPLTAPSSWPWDWFQFHLIHSLQSLQSYPPWFSYHQTDEYQPFQCFTQDKPSNLLIILIINWTTLSIWKLEPGGLFLSSV